LGVDSDEVLSAFPLYRPDGLSAQQALDNLDSKLNSRVFRIDLDALTSAMPKEYDINRAADLVRRELLSRL